MRRRGRKSALQFLYQLDISCEMTQAAQEPTFFRRRLSQFFATFVDLDADERAFAERLALGVIEHRQALDTKLQALSRRWQLRRMDTVDRNALRLSAFELLHCLDVPQAVSINEAVELVKCFGSTESAAFINGILDTLKKRHADADAGDDVHVDKTSLGPARATLAPAVSRAKASWLPAAYEPSRP